jgi:hypothetical protein
LDVGFLKLFLTTQYVDFSNIPQLSPLVKNSSLFVKDSRVEPQIQTQSTHTWDTIVIPVIQRRAPLQVSPLPQGEWFGRLIYPNDSSNVALTVSFYWPFVAGRTTEGSGTDQHGKFSIQSAQFTYMLAADYVGTVTFLQRYEHWPGQVWFFMGTVRKDSHQIFGQWHDSPQDGRKRTGTFNLECVPQVPQSIQ